MSVPLASSVAGTAPPLFISSSARSSNSSLTMSNSRFPVEDSSKRSHTSDQKSREQNFVSVESWTKDPIKQPVSGAMDNKSLRKEASSLFKAIQSYMGDRKSKTSPDQVSYEQSSRPLALDF